MKLIPPYYIVSFTPNSNKQENQSSIVPIEHLVQLEKNKQPGLLGSKLVSDKNGQDKTISYWEDLESIRFWKMNEEHLASVDKDKSFFFKQYHLDISKAE